MIQKPFRGIQLNRTHPLAKGLVGYWLFNELTGETVFDSSDNDNNGTLENGVAWGGSGLVFDGVDDHITIPSTASIIPSTGFSYGAWFKVSGDTNKYILAKGSDETDYPDNIYVLRSGWSGADNKIAGAVYDKDGAGWTIIEYDSDLNDGNWHHAICIKDGNDFKMYVDGLFFNTVDITGYTFSGIGNLNIGAAWYTAGHFNGSIGSAHIYNRALSAEEVTWLYREPYAMFEPAFNPALLYSAAPPVGAIWYYNMLRRRNR